MTVATGPGWELRLGRWQDVLADVTADALISDPPYSEKTHSGHGSGAADSNGAVSFPQIRDNRARQAAGLLAMRQHIAYSSWNEDDVNAFVDDWSSRVGGWLVSITDHTLAPGYVASMEGAGRYVFAPVPMVEPGSRVRLAGDGPSSWTCYVVVGRPKAAPYSKWGTLPGAYIGSGKGDRCVIGGKDSGIMRAIVRDYTRPGDLVVDPCAGGGTTLLAAVMEGRRAIGAEMDPKHFEIARKRLESAVITPPLFVDAPMKQRGFDL